MLWIVPFGNNIFIRYSFTQLFNVDIDKSSPEMVLIYRFFTLNQDNFKDFFISQHPSSGMLPTT
jgi:hypothetical protein